MDQSSLALVAGAVVLVALVLATVVLRLQRERVLAWVQSLFRRPSGPGRPPGPRHYYKPYWS